MMKNSRMHTYTAIRKTFVTEIVKVKAKNIHEAIERLEDDDPEVEVIKEYAIDYEIKDCQRLDKQSS